MQMNCVNSKFLKGEKKMFKPSLKRNSSYKSIYKTTFEERQEKFKNKKNKKLKKLQRESNRFSYKPTINQNNDELLKKAEQRKKRYNSARGIKGSDRSRRSSRRKKNSARKSTRKSSSRQLRRPPSAKKERAMKSAMKEMRKPVVSKRLYQTPGKENKPYTVLAVKPVNKNSKFPLVMEESKIVAKVRNKELRRRVKIVKETMEKKRKKEQKNVMKNGIIIHDVEVNPKMSDSFRAQAGIAQYEFEIFESAAMGS